VDVLADVHEEGLHGPEADLGQSLAKGDDVVGVVAFQVA
jgi:hypothetical protein